MVWIGAAMIGKVWLVQAVVAWLDGARSDMARRGGAVEAGIGEAGHGPVR